MNTFKYLAFLMLVSLSINIAWCAEGGFIGETVDRVTNHHSNKGEIRAKLSSNNWIPIYGKTVEEGDWAVVAACTYFGCLSQYFDYYIDETQQRIQKQLPNVGRDVFIQLLERAFSEKGRIFSQFGLELEAGIATYSRWKNIIYDEPRTEKCKVSLPLGGWTWGVCPSIEQVEKKVSLPNHHQPYFRFRILKPQTSSSYQQRPNTNPQISNPQQRPTTGLPSNSPMSNCLCWGSPPAPYANEPRCASNMVHLQQCGGVCPNGYPPFLYVCN